MFCMKSGLYGVCCVVLDDMVLAQQENMLFLMG